MKTIKKSEEKDLKVWAVFQIPTKEAKIFAGAQPVQVSELMTNNDAHDYCKNMNQCGYIDEMILRYDVILVEKY
jgi:hypothetical protein